MGEVIEFPVQRTCFACVHYDFDFLHGTVCRLFDEPVDSELFAARDCQGFEHE